ncbi:MAG: protein kinase [Planctomycetota bacterium]|nr:protein kinase [Planctomycetota bacterium]
MNNREAHRNETEETVVHPLLDHRFAAIAREMALITQTQHDEAIQSQEEASAQGRPVLSLAQIWMKSGLLSMQQCMSILEEARVRTPTCSRCGSPYDNATLHSHPSALCPRCKRSSDEFVTEVSLAPSLGRYQLIQEVGRGGMGVVYKAYDPQLNRHLALKILRDPETNPVVQKRFRREGVLAARLSHPNIIRVFELGWDGDPSEEETIPFIAMEFVEGKPLDQHLEQLSFSRKLNLLCDILAGMSHAHSHGIMHRDIKPANILIHHDDHPVITDFGLAKWVNDTDELTVSGLILGTCHYMAPEQIRGDSNELGAHTDVWSLGVLMYLIFTGELPFRGKTLNVLSLQILDRLPTPLRKLQPDLPPEIEIICLKALEKNVTNRYATASSFHEDLNRFRNNETIVATAPSRWTLFKGQLGRHRIPLIITCLLSLATALILSFGMRALVAEQNISSLLRERTKIYLESAHQFRRVGAYESLDDFAIKTRKACGDVMRSHPRLAEPHIVLARLERILMHDEEAMLRIERALELEPAHPMALYQWVVMQTRSNLRRLEFSMSIDPERSPQDFDPNWISRRKQIFLYHKRLEEVLAKNPSALSSNRVFCIRGIVAMLSGDHEKAIQQMEQSLSFFPPLEESYENMIRLLRLTKKYSKAFQLALQGHQADRGSLAIKDQLTSLRIFLAPQKGDQIVPEFLTGIRELSEIIADDPTQPIRWSRRSHAYFKLATFLPSNSEESQDAYRKAIADITQALSRTHSAHLNLQKNHLTLRAWIRISWLKSIPDKALADTLRKNALNDLRDAIKLRPKAPLAYLLRGTLHQYLAQKADLKAQSTLSKLQDSLSDYELSIRYRLPAPNPDAQFFKIQVLDLLAEHGPLDDRPKYLDSLFGSIDLLKPIIGDAQNPKNDLALLLRAKIHVKRGIQLFKKGERPVPMFESAINDYTRALQAGGRPEPIHEGRGNVYFQWGQYLISQRLNPLPSFKNAEKELLKLVSIEADKSSYWNRLGQIQYWLALSASQISKDTVQALQYLADSIDSLIHGLEIDSNNRNIQQSLGWSYFQKGLIYRDENRDPTRMFQSALQTWERATSQKQAADDRLLKAMGYCRKYLSTQR